MRVGIIGHGKVGQHVYQCCLYKEWHVLLTSTSRTVTWKDMEQDHQGILEWLKVSKALESLDLMFVCLPTGDGVLARDIMLLACQEGVPVVTCEKGALANYFSDLKEFLPLIGYRATVGAGSGIMPFMQENIKKLSVSAAHAVLNGSLNYLADNCQSGLDPQKVFETMQMKGLIEPGSTDILSAVTAETEDVFKKAKILLHTCFGEDRVSVVYKKQESGYPQDFLKKDDRRPRFVVSFQRRFCYSPSCCDIGGSGFLLDGKDWVASGRFVPLRVKPLEILFTATEAENNGVLMECNEYFVLKTGIGAGPRPTVGAMMTDAVRLLGQT